MKDDGTGGKLVAASIGDRRVLVADDVIPAGMVFGNHMLCSL